MKNKFLYIAVLSLVVVGLSLFYFLPKSKYQMSKKQSNNTTLSDSSKPDISVKIINQRDQSTIRILHDVLSERYNVIYSNVDYQISIQYVYDNESEKETRDEIIKIYITPEPYLPKLDGYDLVLGFDHIVDERYLRLPYYYYAGDFFNMMHPGYKREDDKGKCNPNKEHFACFLTSNDSKINSRDGSITDGIIARISMFHSLSKYKFVASGGRIENNIGMIIPGSDTYTWLSNCKFVIAYENQSHNGYITEKPFQAYFSGAIPLYYADRTAVSDINKESVIYAGDFNTEQDIIKYIQYLDTNDDAYCKKWNQPIVLDPEISLEAMKGRLRQKVFSIIDRKLPGLAREKVA